MAATHLFMNDLSSGTSAWMDAPPRPAAKRFSDLSPEEERPWKFLAADGSSRSFGSMTREEYIQKRVHPKLHVRAADLSDEHLAELGSMDFSKQFAGIAAVQGALLPAEMFGEGGRDAYMKAHVHRKLHGYAASIGDEELLELGMLSFNDQFNVLEGVGAGTRVAPQQAAITPVVQGDLFGGAGREAYMQQHIHRKLHGKAQTLSDQELLALGKMNFNEQFPALGAERDVPGALQPARPPEDPFMGHGRESYLAARVHRKLHTQAAQLSDQDLWDLGQLSFNQQFTYFESLPPTTVDLFQGLGRHGYMQQRVHRKLHARAAQLGDQELLELGRLSFNDQFPACDRAEAARAVAPQPTAAPGAAGLGLGMPTVVPPPLNHGHGVGLGHSPSSGQVLGQTPGHGLGHAHPPGHGLGHAHPPGHGLGHAHSPGQGLGHAHPPGQGLGHAHSPGQGLGHTHPPGQGLGHVQAHVHAHPHPAASGGPSSFGGLGREAYMATRVHRRLHPQAARLSDQQLVELGQMSFNQQFTHLESLPVLPEPKPDLFPGQGREGYMQLRVHRKLHAKAAALTDSELLELGKLSFNEQFPRLESVSVDPVFAAVPGLAVLTGLTESASSIFGGLSREAYVMQRIHRKLHAQAAGLSDEQLLEVGRLSFSLQFPYFENSVNCTEQEAASMDFFPGLGREGYMQARVHRKLHGKASQLPDKELFELGKLSFNEQFPYFENMEAWTVLV